jgi:anti-sigma factor RsiW
MRCQDFERLILQGEDRKLSREEERVLEQHLASCEACFRFEEFRRELRLSVRSVPSFGPTPDLDERVRRACRAELVRRYSPSAQPERPEKKPSVPRPLWAALGALTFLTVGFLIPGIEKFLEDQRITWQTAAVLLLLLQNTLTLFSLPVILRRSSAGVWRYQDDVILE